MNILNRKENCGFTLVELMVVVAIIGMLAALAIPNFKKYRLRTKTVEAKIALASIYTSEEAFFGDYDQYHTCLRSMGFNPTTGYYSIGFNTSNAPDLSATIPNCNGGLNVGQDLFLATKRVSGVFVSAAAWGAAPTNFGVLDPVSFTAGACGYLDPGNLGLCIPGAGNADVWTINENKVLTNVNMGY